MNARTSDRAARGFTLIELLVALTLFGLISVVVMGGLRFGTRVWETGDTRAHAAAEVEAVQGILRRYLAQATLPKPIGRRAGASEPFVGDDDRLRFVTLNPGHVGIGGLYLVELAMAEGRGGEAGTLELAWRLYRPDEALTDGALVEPVAPSEEETLAAGQRTLLSDVESATFAYFASDGPGFSDGEWEETWTEAGQLPDLVALNVAFTEGSGRTWPLLVIQTRLATEGR